MSCLAGDIRGGQGAGGQRDGRRGAGSGRRRAAGHCCHQGGTNQSLG